MKGRELSARFFNEIALPLIERELPECVPFLAAGVPGGSQAHGNDDEISRDHGWGPSFVVLWEQEPHERFGERLKELLASLPREFLGFASASGRVEEIDEFIRSLVGCERPPQAEIDWLHLSEEFLFELVPGRMFHDPSGSVTRRLEEFSYYPDDVWRHRLSVSLRWGG